MNSVKHTFLSFLAASALAGNASAQQVQKTHKIILKDITDTFQAKKQEPLLSKKKSVNNGKIQLRKIQEPLRQLEKTIQAAEKWSPIHKDFFHKTQDTLSWTEDGRACKLILEIGTVRASEKEPKENEIFIIDRIDTKLKTMDSFLHTKEGAHVYKGVSRKIMIEIIGDSAVVYYKQYDNSLPHMQQKKIWEATPLNERSKYKKLSLSEFDAMVNDVAAMMNQAKHAYRTDHGRKDDVLEGKQKTNTTKEQLPKKIHPSK